MNLARSPIGVISSLIIEYLKQLYINFGFCKRKWLRVKGVGINKKQFYTALHRLENSGDQP